MALAVEPFPRQQGLRLVGAGGQQQLSLLLERQTTPGPGGKPIDRGDRSVPTPLLPSLRLH